MTRTLRRFRPVLLGLTLAVIALVGIACGRQAAETPAATSAAITPAAGGGATAPAPSTSAPAAPATAGAAGEIPVGVDAEGNFYRGNPNAAVKLTEYSDFQ